MRDVVVQQDAELDEVVHRERVVRVRRQQLRLPAEGDEPPLVVERTEATGGAHLPPVVLVHGFCQNRYSWRVSRRSLVAHLAAEGFDVISVELRGHGLSREAGAGNASRFADYVRDVQRVVERLDRPFVVGHSLGGAVGVGVATRAELAGLVHLAGIYTFASRNPLKSTLACAPSKPPSPTKPSSKPPSAREIHSKTP